MDVLNSTTVDNVIQLMTDVIGIFSNAPLNWFVYMALVMIGVGIVTRLIKPGRGR